MQIGQILRKAILPLVGLSVLGALILQIRAPRAAVAAAPVTGASASASGTAASLSGRVRAEGRVAAYPGAEVAVSTEVSGTIARLYVQEKSVVRKGDLIAELSADVERAAAEEARARTGEADADLALLESEVSRQERRHASGAATAQALERAEHDRDAARARRALAAATTRRLASMLKKTRIVAPIDGVVIARLVQPGETVAGGTHLVTIADLAHTRIEAEVDEFDAGRIGLGVSATVSAEGFGDATWRGQVEEIPDAVSARRLKPQDPGRPTDTRVLLVKIALAQPSPLKLGQRVQVAIAAP